MVRWLEVFTSLFRVWTAGQKTEVAESYKSGEPRAGVVMPLTASWRRAARRRATEEPKGRVFAVQAVFLEDN